MGVTPLPWALYVTILRTLSFIHCFFKFSILLVGNVNLHLGAVHKVQYVTLFLANFDPSPVTLCHTSQDPPKYVTHLGPPRFLVGLVQKSRTKVPCINSISIVRRGFC